MTSDNMNLSLSKVKHCSMDVAKPAKSKQFAAEFAKRRTVIIRRLDGQFRQRKRSDTETPAMVPLPHAAFQDYAHSIF